MSRPRLEDELRTCMHEGIVDEAFAFRIGRDVCHLALVVCFVNHPVSVITFLPNCSTILLAHGEREAAFDEANRLFERCGGREKNMHMIRHDHKRMELKAATIAIAEQGGNHEFSICSTLKDPYAL